MSWSITLIGTPEKISVALQEHSKKLTGDSKEEFDQALPNLLGLVGMNHTTGEKFYLKLQASGHAYTSVDQSSYGTCSVSIEYVGAILV